MAHPIIRFRPSLNQEQRIIGLVVKWATNRVHNRVDLEPRLVRMLTQDCCFETETFDVHFRAIHELVRDNITYTCDRQRQAFDRAALHHFLCRVIGTQNVYKRESAHKRRRAYFDRCVQNADLPGVQATPLKPVEPTNPVVAKAGSIQDQVYTKLINDHPELVVMFLDDRKQEFIDFCLTK